MKMCHRFGLASVVSFSLLAGAHIIAFGPVARAAVLMEESFEYVAGTTVPATAGSTMNGGSFSSPFSQTGNGWFDNSGSANIFNTSAGSLQFSAGNEVIISSGNSLSTGGDNLYAQRNFTGPSVGTFYLSYLWRTESVPTLYQGLQFGNFYAGLRASGDRSIGLSRSFGNAPSFVASDTTMLEDTTYLMVLRLTLQNGGVGATNDTAELFLNQFTEGTPDAVLTGLDMGAFNRFIFYGTQNRVAYIDELRVATTFQGSLDYYSVPEPSSAILMIAAGAALFFGRRKLLHTMRAPP